ncbi:hypothetical protein D3C87_80460 [compost metagenome]
MAELRGGSTIGNVPILGRSASNNNIAKIQGNMVVDSAISDDGTNVTINLPIKQTSPTGTAPFSVVSNTVVVNLNADMVDGYQFNQGLLTTNSPTFSSMNLNGNLYLNSSAPIIEFTESDQATNEKKWWMVPDSKSLQIRTLTDAAGTGVTAMSIVRGSGTAVTNIQFPSLPVYAATFNSTVGNGTAPFTVSSTTMVTNLNAQYLNGMGATSTISSNNVVSRDSGGDTQIRSLTLTAATGLAPLVVSSTTAVTNLNADMVDGYQTSTTAVANTIPVYNASAQLVGSITGNAATATTLATARTLAISGDITGSASFNGSANATIAATLANSGVTASTYRSVTVDAKGRVISGTNPTTLAGYGITDAVSSSASFIELRNGANTAGAAYFDFHTSGNATDFDSRIIADGGTTTAGFGRLSFAGNDGYFDMDQVQMRNKLWVRPATAYGTATSLHLAIGDSDTGINWIGDGMLDFYSNNAVVMKFSADGYVSVRNSTGAYTSLANVRPTTISTAAPSGGQDGDVWLQY